MSSLEDRRDDPRSSPTAHIIALRSDVEGLYVVARRRVEYQLSDEDRIAVQRVRSHPVFAERWKRCLDELEATGIVTFDAVDEERFLDDELSDLQSATVVEDLVRKEFQRMFLELESVISPRAS